MDETLFGLPRRPLLGLLAVLAGLGVAASWALADLAGRGALLGMGALAWFLGLRHAFDADHIAAIDNVTRKLRQDGQRPVAVGAFFSAGHATVVIALSAALAIAVHRSPGQLAVLSRWGGLFGTAVSAGFLTVIGTLNLAIFRQLRSARRADGLENGQLEALLRRRGLLARMFRFVYRYIDRSWKMYPLGVLFGLGFDTATEIALLGLSATAARQGALPAWGILVFPLLFTAGMMLMDSLDGIVMLKAYDWAMSDAGRKLSFNVVITGLSVVVALGIGALEWLQVLAHEFGWRAGPWRLMQGLDFSALGLMVVTGLLATWLGAFLYYRRGLRAPLPRGVR